MPKTFQKSLPVFILPVLLFAAATNPFSCNVSRDGAVFKSKDGSSTFTQKAKIEENKSIGSRQALSLAIDHENPNIIYFGTKGSGLYKSTDEAENWQQVADKNGVLDNRGDVLDIEISPKDANLVYLAVLQNGYGKLLQSKDKTATFKEVYVVAKSGMAVNAVEVDHIDENIVYIGTAEGNLLRSKDAGSSWETLKSFGGPIFDLKLDRNNNQLVYALTNKGIFKSSDQGKNWQSLADKMKSFKEATKPSAMMIDPINQKVLYVALKTEIIKSSDGGETWNKLNILAPGKSVMISAMAQDQVNTSLIYYSAGSVLYKSSNGGQSWTTSKVASNRAIAFIKIDPMSSDIVYVGMGG